jgi:hypothetical protein
MTKRRPRRLLNRDDSETRATWTWMSSRVSDMSRRSPQGGAGSEPRDPFDSAFGLAQDKPVGNSFSALLIRSIDPFYEGGCQGWALAHLLMSDSRPKPNKRVRRSLWCGRPARTSSAAVESCRRDACTTIGWRLFGGAGVPPAGRAEIPNSSFLIPNSY